MFYFGFWFLASEHKIDYNFSSFATFQSATVGRLRYANSIYIRQLEPGLLATHTQTVKNSSRKSKYSPTLDTSAESEADLGICWQSVAGDVVIKKTLGCCRGLLSARIAFFLSAAEQNLIPSVLGMPSPSRKSFHSVHNFFELSWIKTDKSYHITSHMFFFLFQNYSYLPVTVNNDFHNLIGWCTMVTTGARLVHCGTDTYVVLRVDVVARLSQSRFNRFHVARPHILQKCVDADFTHSLHVTPDNTRTEYGEIISTVQFNSQMSQCKNTGLLLWNTFCVQTTAI